MGCIYLDISAGGEKPSPNPKRTPEQAADGTPIDRADGSALDLSETEALSAWRAGVALVVRS